MNTDGNWGPWIDWAGGECPIPDGTPHEVRLHGDKNPTYDEHPETWSWEQGEGGLRRLDIIAYRVRLPEPDLLRQAIEALREARDALQGCYEVCEWPASGTSDQDEAIRSINAVLAAYDAKGKA